MGDKSKFVKGIKVRRSYCSLGVFGSVKVVLRSEEVMAWWIKGKTRNSWFMRKLNRIKKRTVNLYLKKISCKYVLD